MSTLAFALRRKNASFLAFGGHFSDVHGMKFRSLIIIAILIAGCSGTNSTRFGSGEKLVRMKGSSTLDELIREWAQRFTETHDGIVIEVQSGTSSSSS